MDPRRKKQKQEQAAQSDDGDEEGSSAPEVSTSEDEDDEDASGTDSSGDSDDHDGSDEEEDSSDDDDDDKKELQVDFRFFEPAERDFHGLRALLGSYLDGKGYDVGGLVDAVIAQGAKGDGVGTVVHAIDATADERRAGGSGGGKTKAAAAAAKKADDDDPADPIAVVTAVGLEGYRSAPFASGVRDFVLARAEAAGKRAAFEAAWDAPRAALLLNERLVNCPPQIAPPLVQYLFEEVERARREEAEERAELEAAARAAGGAAAAPPPPSAAAACGYAFDRYVLLTRVYEDPQEAEEDEEEEEEEDDDGDEKQQQQKKKQKKKKSKGNGGNSTKGAAPVLVYTRPEDRFFHARSTAAFTFPVEGRPVSRGELRPLRLALVLPASEVAAARRDLDRAVGNARAMPPPPPVLPKKK